MLTIGLSLLGKVGTRLQVTANYDTEATFDFQQLIKLEYTPTEDDIVRKIEVGNVNMPLNSSLITGAQSLFGVKTELQFGKTNAPAAGSSVFQFGSHFNVQLGENEESIANTPVREFSQKRVYQKGRSLYLSLIALLVTARVWRSKSQGSRRFVSMCA